MIKSILKVIFLSILITSGCSFGEKQIKEVQNYQPEETRVEIDPRLDEVIDDLIKNRVLVPLGDLSISDKKLISEEIVELGKMLFFDPRLSGNNEVSCASCHDPKLGYGDGRATFKTITGEDGARNSQTIINVGYYTSNFWDGRAGSLEEQALGPIENPHEMNQSLEELVVELKEIEGYEELFLKVFHDGITLENIGKALAAFERLVVVKDTRYDRFLEGDREALTAEEIRGLDLFVGKAMCITCHNGENLSDNKFYNLGLLTEDEGRFSVTKDEGDIGRFRTPSLYGITHTSPYMHNGSIETLEEVIEFYNRGGDGHPNTSIFMEMFMSEINLSTEEKADLLAFLKALGGEVPIFTNPELLGMD